MNFYGQLGDGTKKDKSTPVNITANFNLSDGEVITKIEAGSHHSIALTSLGRVFYMGKNRLREYLEMEQQWINLFQLI